MRDGIDCCPYCRRPMYRRQKLDLDDWPPLVIAQRFGIKPHKRLAHAKCNRSAGARLKNWLASQHPELLRTRMTTARPARQPRRQQRRAW